MRFAKLSFIIGAASMAAGAANLLGSWALGLGAVLIFVAAAAGAIALEEREAVEGLAPSAPPLEPATTAPLLDAA